MFGFRIDAPNAAFAIAVLSAITLYAQSPGGRGPGLGPRAGGGPPPGAPGRMQAGPGRGIGQAERPPLERTFGNVPRGRWWSDPAVAARLGLTADQQKQMDSVFQQNRPKLIDLNAALQKEELALEPLLNVDRPDEGKTLAQIDRVAQARAELEKANARMLLGLRAALTPDQWKRLQTQANEIRPMPQFNFGPDGAPGERPTLRRQPGQPPAPPGGPGGRFEEE